MESQACWPALASTLESCPKAELRQLYASASEIHHHLKNAARAESPLPRMWFGTDIPEMRWRAESARWELETTTGRYRCRVLIIAAGRLPEPRMPAIPGLEGFPGPVFHSSAWDVG
jgi:cation diffusion facilitator CzcD-associated flavoprotein CzcO